MIEMADTCSDDGRACIAALFSELQQRLDGGWGAPKRMRLAPAARGLGTAQRLPEALEKRGLPSPEVQCRGLEPSPGTLARCPPGRAARAHADRFAVV